MKRVLLDTCVFSWSLQGPERLTDAARQAVDQAEKIHLSAISIYEIAQKVRLRKWPEMDSYSKDILSYIYLSGIEVIDTGSHVSFIAGTMEWSHRDPFDRIIAATALHHTLPVVSADKIFDGIVTRIW